MTDPQARDLVPPLLALGLRAVEAQPLLFDALRAASLGLVDHVSLRTAAIDDELRTALARGARQLVILGAGLDARAYRLRELDDVVVFEVDHPATQRDKSSRLAKLRPAAKEVRWVGVDFERGSLGAALDRAGHDPVRPTAWIWEGVTPYLDAAAVHGTLRCLAERSAPRSSLLVTYVTPELVGVPYAPKRTLRLGFSVLGEPIKSTLSPGQVRALLGEHGFEVTSDSGSADWALRFLVGEPSRIEVLERLAAAVKPEVAG